MLQVQECFNVKDSFTLKKSWERKKEVKSVAIVAKEIQELIQRLNRAVKSEKAMRTALTTLMAVHKPRIFESGQDSGKSKIGKYSTNPISIAKSNQARSTGQTFFPGGYAEYKQKIGKGGDVNFRNFDQMMMDYGIIQNGSQFGFGFQNHFNYEKSQWLQDKYNKDVFDLSEQELNLLGDVHKAEVEKLL